MTRTFYQSHMCEGFRAKITIEWDIPKSTDEPTIRNRLSDAEDIADAILKFAGPKMIHMVQSMRGYSVSPPPREAPPERDKCPDCGQDLPLLYPCQQQGCPTSRGSP